MYFVLLEVSFKPSCILLYSRPVYFALQAYKNFGTRIKSMHTKLTAKLEVVARHQSPPPELPPSPSAVPSPLPSPSPVPSPSPSPPPSDDNDNDTSRDDGGFKVHSLSVVRK